MKLVIVIKM